MERGKKMINYLTLVLKRSTKSCDRRTDFFLLLVFFENWLVGLKKTPGHKSADVVTYNYRWHLEGEDVIALALLHF